MNASCNWVDLSPGQFGPVCCVSERQLQCHLGDYITPLPRHRSRQSRPVRTVQGGYIFYAGASLAGAGYCRQCRRRPAILLTTPTVAGLPGLCENFRPTTSKSSPILRLLSSHWAYTSVVRTRVVGVANVGDSLRRLSSLQHRIYNLLGTVSLYARRCRSRSLIYPSLTSIQTSQDFHQAA